MNQQFLASGHECDACNKTETRASKLLKYDSKIGTNKSASLKEVLQQTISSFEQTFLPSTAISIDDKEAKVCFACVIEKQETCRRSRFNICRDLKDIAARE
jgi:hypothetical protein